MAFGLQDTERFTPGDLTGDGVPEIYGSGFQADKDGKESAGRAWVYDGAKSLASGQGELLYELPDPSVAAGKAFGFTASKVDYNKGQTPDLYVSSLTNHERTGGNLPQESYVFEGGNGSLLKTLRQPPAEQQQTQGDDSGSGFGWSSRAAGDLNGDCEPDFVAAAPFQNINGIQDVGKTYFFLSDGPSACPAQVPQPVPPPVPPQPVLGPCPVEGAPGYLNPAKLRVSRARVLREDRRLDVLAPITARAEGDVAVTYQGDDRVDTFDADVTQANTELDEIRILEPITRGQARLGTGIVNLNYVDPSGVRRSMRRERRSETTEDWELADDQVPAQLARCGGYLSIQSSWPTSSTQARPAAPDRDTVRLAPPGWPPRAGDPCR